MGNSLKSDKSFGQIELELSNSFYYAGD